MRKTVWRTLMFGLMLAAVRGLGQTAYGDMFLSECDLKILKDFKAKAKGSTYPEPNNGTRYFSADDTIRVVFHLPGAPTFTLSRLLVVPSNVKVLKTKFVTANDTQVLRYNSPESGETLSAKVSEVEVTRLTLVAVSRSRGEVSDVNLTSLQVVNLTGCLQEPQKSPETSTPMYNTTIPSTTSLTLLRPNHTTIVTDDVKNGSYVITGNVTATNTNQTVSFENGTVSSVSNKTETANDTVFQKTTPNSTMPTSAVSNFSQAWNNTGTNNFTGINVTKTPGFQTTSINFTFYSELSTPAKNIVYSSEKTSGQIMHVTHTPLLNTGKTVVDSTSAGSRMTVSRSGGTSTRKQLTRETTSVGLFVGDSDDDNAELEIQISIAGVIFAALEVTLAVAFLVYKRYRNRSRISSIVRQV